MAKDRWSLRNIYLYLVCLITLIMVIFSVVSVVRSTVEMLYPDPGYYEAAPVDAKGQTGLTQVQLDKQNEIQRQQSRRQSILGLVGGVALLIVAGPLYIYHWRKIETEHEGPVIDPGAGS